MTQMHTALLGADLHYEATNKFRYVVVENTVGTRIGLGIRLKRFLDHDNTHHGFQNIDR